MAITFTQFLRPNGGRKEVFIDLEPEVEAKAALIEAAGYRFEIEVLSNEITVHATITNDDADHAQVLVPNGPAVPVKISEMILNFKL